MLGVTLVPWAEGMRHRNSDDNVDITGAWSRNGEVRSPRGEDFNPETCKPGADRNTVSPGASSDHGADTQGPKEQNAMVSTLSRAFSGGKGDGAGEGPSKDGTGVPGVYMEKSVNLDSVSECQGTSENNGLERAVVAGIGKVPTLGTSPKGRGFESHRCHQFYVTTQRQIVARIVVDWSSGTER